MCPLCKQNVHCPVITTSFYLKLLGTFYVIILIIIIIIIISIIYCVDRDSLVGIATRCGWTVRRLNPGVVEIFRTSPDRPWGPPSLLYNGYRVCFPGARWPGRDVNPSPTSIAKFIKERLEPYLYSPSGPLWPVLGWNLSLLLLLSLVVSTRFAELLTI